MIYSSVLSIWDHLEEFLVWLEADSDSCQVHTNAALNDFQVESDQ